MPGPRPLQPDDPIQIGAYKLVGCLGFGGQGVVFLGQAPSGERVAVKMLHSMLSSDPKIRESFLLEISATQQVQQFCTAACWMWTPPVTALAAIARVPEPFQRHTRAAPQQAPPPREAPGAVGLQEKTIQLWDVATGRLVSTPRGQTDAVLSVAFSLDGKKLASASLDKTVRLWDVATGRLIATLSGHTDAVLSVTLSPDGKALSSAGQDKTARTWRL